MNLCEKVILRKIDMAIITTESFAALASRCSLPWAESEEGFGRDGRSSLERRDRRRPCERSPELVSA